VRADADGQGTRAGTTTTAWRDDNSMRGRTLMGKGREPARR
jgi:hypothetical protein